MFAIALVLMAAGAQAPHAATPKARPHVPFECPGALSGRAADYAKYAMACSLYVPESGQAVKKALSEFTSRHPGCYEELTSHDAFKAAYEDLRRDAADPAKRLADPTWLAELRHRCADIAKAVDADERPLRDLVPDWPSSGPVKPSRASLAGALSFSDAYPAVRERLVDEGCTLGGAVASDPPAKHPVRYFPEIACGADHACHADFTCGADAVRVRIRIDGDRSFVEKDGGK